MTSTLYNYTNGNYEVGIYPDGTKVKICREERFDADFPDSIDIKITNRCDMGCPMCHECSTPNGAHAKLKAKFFRTLNKGTELAIGGGNPLTHPRLVRFLKAMKRRGVICNLTVNENHFLISRAFVDRLINRKLISGLGISVTTCDDFTVNYARSHPNVVFHLICGIVSDDVINRLADKDLKILFLGYKRKGRGERYFSPHVEQRILDLEQRIADIDRRFKVVSYDNLALRQLKIKDKLSPEAWDKYYFGDDGTCSMYIDMVSRTFGVSSTSRERYLITPDVKTMFRQVREESNANDQSV